MRRTILLLSGVLALAGLYFATWPVPVDPVAWESPPDRGYTGDFARNSLLTGMEQLSIGVATGPESVARDDSGRLYVSSIEGVIVRLDPDGTDPEVWAETGGRPLGMAFGRDGVLYVADGHRGLLAIDTSGVVRLLADSAAGTPIGLADDVAIASDGRVYFTDATSKFGLLGRGGEDAATLDVLEHGGHGRLLQWDPTTRLATVIQDGFNFPNGVALTSDERAVLMTETGSYRILRVGIAGADRGVVTTLIEELPGFPDNISPGSGGRYWVALFAPRNALLDGLSSYPRLRKALMRVPSILRPKASDYGHIIAIDEAGRILEDRQDPSGGYPKTTDVLETGRYLYIGSIEARTLARVPR